MKPQTLGQGLRTLPRGKKALDMRLAMLAVCVALGCQTTSSADVPRVPNRYWITSAGDGEAVREVASQLHMAIATSLGNVLEAGFPRGCRVSRPPTPGPSYPECLEESEPHDGLWLSPGGPLMEFVTLDFPSSRLYMFEVYLIPEARYARTLGLDELSDYPRVAVPPFPLPESAFQGWLVAISQGLQAAGAVPFDERKR